MITSKYFILYLKEAEFRRNVNDLDHLHQLKEIFDILNYIRDLKFDSLLDLMKIKKK